jgi:hypothetical protein
VQHCIIISNIPDLSQCGTNKTSKYLDVKNVILSYIKKICVHAHKQGQPTFYHNTKNFLNDSPCVLNGNIKIDKNHFKCIQVHIEHYLTRRLTHTICNRSHNNICKEWQKSDYTKQKPTNNETCSINLK